MKGATRPLRWIEMDYKFQSTLPMKGATQVPVVLPCCRRFQSTLPMKGATLGFSSLC